jgi:hypothetical protein
VTIAARLAALLDPQSDRERDYVAWLLSWDTDTVSTITGMIERRVTGRERSPVGRSLGECDARIRGVQPPPADRV